MRLTLPACLACALAASGSACVDDELDTEEAALPLQVISTSRLDALPSPPRIYTPIAGVDGTQYNLDAARLQQLGYSQLTLSSVRMPAGDTRFSSVFHKDANVVDTFWRTGLTVTDLAAHLAQRPGLGFRVIDLIARPTSSGNRYDALWIKETVRPPSSHGYDLTRAQLDSKIDEQKLLGLRPIRIHGYPVGTATRYAVVFVQDSLGVNFRVAVDETASGYQTRFNENVAAGFAPLDKAAYPYAGATRYAGIFVADPSITLYTSHSDLSQAAFASTNVQYANLGYVMADAEYYSLSTTTNQPRFSGIWLQRADTQVRSNLDLSTTGTASWPRVIKDTLAALRADVAGYGGRVGFVVEDLRTGNYIGVSLNDPFYMASNSKVLIAAAVLDRIDDDALDADTSDLTLATVLDYMSTDILEVADSPGTPQYANVQTSLGWMINSSSTNATDRLTRELGPAAINDYLRASGIVDVGEITSICELDRRIVEPRGTCIRTDMTCADFERWYREDARPPTPLGRDCVDNKLSAESSSHFSAYYATLANSITPLQYAKLWRRVLEADILSPMSSNTLAAVLARTVEGYMSGLENVFFDVQGTKFGDKRSVQSVVGIGYGVPPAIDQADGDDSRLDLSTTVAEFSFSMFTEGFASTDANKDAARTLMRNLAGRAMTILGAMRSGTPSLPPNPS